MRAHRHLARYGKILPERQSLPGQLVVVGLEKHCFSDPYAAARDLLHDWQQLIGPLAAC